MRDVQCQPFELQADIVGVPAAMYVRMSTEHQQYSTANQADVIRQYAGRHGLCIVETYADDGRSGLSLDGRDALKRLLRAVTSGRAAFQAILVYDVSRWGRFLDADESAHYEYLCRQARIAVHYCAEPFDNDGAPMSSLMKAIKRSMAGEYSRELSTKVFRGLCRIVRQGYWHGGTAGYGLRRMLIDASGRPRCVMGFHERKALQTDRVVLVAGPPDEVEVVRWMYRSVADDGMNATEIAGVLNARGIPNDRGFPWSQHSVHWVLTNERYIGHYVYNRQSQALAGPRRENPRDAWVRCENAFPAVVDPDLFRRVQQALATRPRRWCLVDPYLPGLGPPIPKPRDPPPVVARVGSSPPSDGGVPVDDDPNSGTYVLILAIPRPLEVRVGSLGSVRLAAGTFLYVGSARRHLRQRVRRHLAREKRVRWHIDHLTVHPGVVAVGALLLADPALAECELNREVGRRIPGAAPVPRFGTSDCRDRCPGHLWWCGDSLTQAQVAARLGPRLRAEVFEASGLIP